MLSPRNFARQVGLSYNQVLIMCKNGEIKSVKSPRGHFKIPEIELNKFIEKDSYISIEKIEELIRENERLNIKIEQLKKILDM